MLLQHTLLVPAALSSLLCVKIFEMLSCSLRTSFSFLKRSLNCQVCIQIIMVHFQPETKTNASKLVLFSSINLFCCFLEQKYNFVFFQKYCLHYLFQKTINGSGWAFPNACRCSGIWLQINLADECHGWIDPIRDSRLGQVDCMIDIKL